MKTVLRKNQTFIVMSRAQFTVAISTDEEAAASKRMVIYAFSAQINLFISFCHFYTRVWFKFGMSRIVFAAKHLFERSYLWVMWWTLGQ